MVLKEYTVPFTSSTINKNKNKNKVNCHSFIKLFEIIFEKVNKFNDY